MEQMELSLRPEHNIGSLELVDLLLAPDKHMAPTLHPHKHFHNNLHKIKMLLLIAFS
jgi:hypothetical protein